MRGLIKGYKTSRKEIIGVALMIREYVLYRKGYLKPRLKSVDR